MNRNILKESISYPKELSEDAKDFIKGIYQIRECRIVDEESEEEIYNKGSN